MTFAVTAVKAYGIEAEEAVTKRYKQVYILSITAANTDVALDIGNYTGTFWTAAGGSTPGALALLALKDIQTKAKTFIKVGSDGIGGKAQADASYTSTSTLDSSASSGGGATETLTVTDILTTDTLLAVSQYQKGANGTALIDWGNASGGITTNGQLPAEWTGDPGAGAKVRVVYTRTSTTVNAGTYAITMNATNTHIPDITFASGDAPTAYDLVLEWALKDGEAPVEVAG